MDRYAGEHGRDDEPIQDDVVPEDAPRGGVTIPTTNDTGTTTPPISGWGESVEEEVEEEDVPD